MNEFLTQYGVCIILCLLGGLLVMVTYASFFLKPSGVPFVGGILIALGFLTTPHKWLAIFGLVDPGWLMIIQMIIGNKLYMKKVEEFREIIETAYTGDESNSDGNASEEETEKTNQTAGRDAESGPELIVSIPERSETLEWKYALNHVYRLNSPKVFFCICKDKRGKRYLLIDAPSRSEHIEAMTFDLDCIAIKGLQCRKKEMTVILDVKED